jgi:hypothetical protein
LQWAHQVLTAYFGPGRLASTSLDDVPVDDSLRGLGSLGAICFSYFFVAATLLLVWAGWQLSFAHAAQQWPSVLGRVTFSHHEETHNSNIAELKYIYRVGNRDFEGNCISYWGAPTPRAIHNFVKLHPLGSSVLVFYDPANVTRSVLLPGTGFVTKVGFIAGGFLLCCSVGFWFWRSPVVKKTVGQLFGSPRNTKKGKGSIGGDDAMSRLLR